MKGNLENICGISKKSLDSASRQANSLKIIAVTKNQPIQAIKDAFILGIRDFGENKVQEAEGKIKTIGETPAESILIHSKSAPSKIDWHFIGRLQANKVKKAVELFEWIHSVDSIKLAEKINAEAKKQQKGQKVLLQVNVSGEKSKAGFSEREMSSAFPQLLALPHLQIMGLMTIAPISGNAENSRPIFKRLRELGRELQDRFNHPLPHLSMGMSQDYAVAIEEGATMVRIGTALFEGRQMFGS